MQSCRGAKWAKWAKWAMVNDGDDDDHRNRKGVAAHGALWAPVCKDGTFQFSPGCQAARRRARQGEGPQ